MRVLFVSYEITGWFHQDPARLVVSLVSQFISGFPFEQPSSMGPQIFSPPRQNGSFLEEGLGQKSEGANGAVPGGF